jgi:pentatricopeptide repeat protein|tara:strand:- start:275 stop:442 length:168 start_codon:yes stop_codon:yes gene_type:complete
MKNIYSNLSKEDNTKKALEIFDKMHKLHRKFDAEELNYLRHQIHLLSCAENWSGE